MFPRVRTRRSLSSDDPRKRRGRGTWFFYFSFRFLLSRGSLASTPTNTRAVTLLLLAAFARSPNRFIRFSGTRYLGALAASPEVTCCPTPTDWFRTLADLVLQRWSCFPRFYPSRSTGGNSTALQQMMLSEADVVCGELALQR